MHRDWVNLRGTDQNERRGVAVAEKSPGTRIELQRLSDGFSYDDDLRELLHRAATGSQAAPDEPPITFTSVLLAFLRDDGPVSRWFQEFAQQRNVNIDAMSSGFSAVARMSGFAQGDRAPATSPSTSRSVRRVLENAVRVANEVSGESKVLGVRHMMAAYACYPLPDHVDQVRDWNIDSGAWKQEYLIFAMNSFPQENWNDYAVKISQGEPWHVAILSTALALKERARTGQPAAAPNAPNTAPSPATPRPSRPGLLIGDFLSDNPDSPTVSDLLKTENEAHAFARLVAARDIQPPLAIGVFGEWGSGKTFFMNKMRKHIDYLAHETKSFAGKPEDKWPYLEDVVQIQFDAWHYAEQNLWASLVDYIFAKLDAWMVARATQDPAGVDHVLDRLATTQQLKLEALEVLVLRRSERQAAEARAERTRADYQQALKRREAIKPASYLLAAIQRVFANPSANEDARRMIALRDEAVNSLGIAELRNSSERLEAAVMEARTEAGRARLIMHSLLAKLGTAGGVLTAVVVILVVPSLFVFLKDFLADVTAIAALKKVQDTLVAGAALIGGLATMLSRFVAKARAGLAKLADFDDKLQQEIDAQRAELEKSPVALMDREAQEELQKSRQAFEAAEKALAVADANLLAARQDFESGTARGRLNAFIRSKVTSGEYAKHLGIVASIRRDFSQLASLMDNANDSAAESAERKRLEAEATARVDRFIQWLESTKDVKLTIREIAELLNLLEPGAALKKLLANATLFGSLLQGETGELQGLEKTLKDRVDKPRELPRFSRIVLYIDDLDRCEAKKVVEVLQAVHLLLSFPLFVVVVAVDARWVSRALKDHYPGLLADDAAARESGGARPYDYLEKIFQIPYWVRPMDRESAQTFVAGIASTKRRPRAPALPVFANVPGGEDGREGGQDPGADDAPPPLDESAGETQADSAGQRREGTKSKTPIAVPQDIHAGVSLDDHEVAMLRRFAPFVGDTPRRALRFVNIYRLVKTSLPVEVRAALVGERGERAAYRSLIAQLAVANGLPQAAAHFYERVFALSKEQWCTAETLLGNPESLDSRARQQFKDLAAALTSSGDGVEGAEPITAGILQSMTGFARRYSFERR
jgi:hypothetical protein